MIETEYHPTKSYNETAKNSNKKTKNSSAWLPAHCDDNRIHS